MLVELGTKKMLGNNQQNTTCRHIFKGIKTKQFRNREAFSHIHGHAFFSFELAFENLVSEQCSKETLHSNIKLGYQAIISF